MSGETPLMVAAKPGTCRDGARVVEGRRKSQRAGGQCRANRPDVGDYRTSAPVVGELVKHGADVELASKSGFTPLMFAAQQDDCGQRAAFCSAPGRK